MTESDEIRRKRLKFRSAHRGTKEADLLLEAFADAHLGSLSPAQLDEYERLLDAEDPDLWDWLIARQDPPPAYQGEILRLIQAFHYPVPAAIG